MATGRRKWDRAGKEFVNTASEVGLSEERVYCCLVIAGYNIECDLDPAEYFLAREEAPPPPRHHEKTGVYVLARKKASCEDHKRRGDIRHIGKKKERFDFYSPLRS